MRTTKLLASFALAGMILGWASPSPGQEAVIGPGKMLRQRAREKVEVVAGTPHNHPASPLLYEDFENAAGYDLAGWGEDPGPGGVINEDYTNVVLYGTQSLFINEEEDDQTYTTNSFAANDRVWVSFLLFVTALPTFEDAEQTILQLTDNSLNCQTRIRISDAGFVKVYASCGGASASTLVPVLTNITYYVRVEYDNDNGANSAANVEFTTTGIWLASGDNYAAATSTQTATQVSRVLLGHTAAEVATGAEVSFVMDHLLVDDAEIGNYP